MSHHHPPPLLAVLPTALWPVSVNSVAISWTHGGQLPVDPPVCHQHTLPSAGSHTLSVPTLIRLGIHSRSLHIPWGLLVPSVAWPFLHAVQLSTVAPVWLQFLMCCSQASSIEPSWFSSVARPRSRLQQVHCVGRAVLCPSSDTLLVPPPQRQVERQKS